MAVLGFDLSPLKAGVSEALGALRQAGAGVGEAGGDAAGALLDWGRQPRQWDTTLLDAGRSGAAGLNGAWQTLLRVGASGVGLDTGLLDWGRAGGNGLDTGLLDWGRAGGNGFDDAFRLRDQLIARTPAPTLGSGATAGATAAASAAGLPGDPWGATQPYDALFRKYASGYAGVNQDELVEVARALTYLESRGNAGAQGVVVTQGPWAGQRAQGLMQVMPGNAPGVNLLDPDANIAQGLRILMDGYRQWGNWDSAVAAYFGAIDGAGRPTTATDDNGTSGTAYVQQVNQFRQQVRQGPRGAGGNTSGYAFPVAGYRGTVGLHQGQDAGAADLFAPEGTAVTAVRGGSVLSAGWSDIGGWNLAIQGDDGLTYYYAHLQYQPRVAPGQRVEAGGWLGAVGNTGNARETAPHLHLGIGYGIAQGAGPHGGAGENFNAVELLRRILGGP